MKNISLGLVLLPLLICSCNADIIDTDQSNIKINDEKLENQARLVQELSPENPANIYDLAGKVHNDILEVYLSGGYQYNTIEQVSEQIQTIASQNSDLLLLNPGANLPENLDVIQQIIKDPQSKLDQTISNAAMTSVAKEGFSGFMNDMILWRNYSYQEIYESITAYESAVTANPEFNNEDKRIILTTTSIVRYAAYYDTQRKDKDWETSTGHRAGVVSGAVDNSSAAIVRSLVTGIMMHNPATE